MSRVLGLLNLDQRSIISDLRQASRQRNHSSATRVVRSLMVWVFLDVELALWFLFRRSKEAGSLVIWGGLRLLFSQPLLSLLLECPLEIWFKVVEHVPLLDAQVIKASRNFLFLLNRRFRFGLLSGSLSLWVKSQSTVDIIIRDGATVSGDLCHESSASCLVLLVLSRLVPSRTLGLSGLGLLFLLVRRPYFPL